MNIQINNTHFVNLIFERLKTALGISTDAHLAIKLGVKANVFANWKSRGTIDYPALFTLCESEKLDLNFIITGHVLEIAPNVAPNVAPNGIIELAKPDFSTPKIITMSQGKENILFVPVKAGAGYLNGFGDPEYIESLQAYRLPGFDNGTFRMFEIDGQSMLPTLRSRDRIIGQWCDIKDIKDSYVHVIVTKNDGVVVKRVLNRIQKDGVLILKSDGNRYEYPDRIVDPSEVVECWSGVGKISRDLSGPNDLYHRLDDAEGRLAIIENLLKGK